MYVSFSLAVSPVPANGGQTQKGFSNV